MIAITIQSIEEAVGLKVSDDTVIPLCGEWALAGSRLASCLKGDPNREIQDRKEEVLSLLDVNHTQLDIACGQGQCTKDVLGSTVDLPTLIQLLEDISGIAHLKKR